MREMPSTSSTAMSGRVATSRSVRIASPARQVASAVVVDSPAVAAASEVVLVVEEEASVAAVVASEEASAHAVATEVEVLEAHQVVALDSSLTPAQTPPTPSLTLLLVAESQATPSTSATCPGRPATRIL